jgi:hypothetical protein
MCACRPGLTLLLLAEEPEAWFPVDRLQKIQETSNLTETKRVVGYNAIAVFEAPIREIRAC